MANLFTSRNILLPFTIVMHRIAFSNQTHRELFHQGTKVTSSRLEARRFGFLQLSLPVITYIPGTDAQDWSKERKLFVKLSTVRHGKQCLRGKGKTKTTFKI